MCFFQFTEYWGTEEQPIHLHSSVNANMVGYSKSYPNFLPCNHVLPHMKYSSIPHHNIKDIVPKIGKVFQIIRASLQIQNR